MVSFKTHVSQAYVTTEVQTVVDVNVAAPILPSKSDKVVDKVKPK